MYVGQRPSLSQSSSVLLGILSKSQRACWVSPYCLRMSLMLAVIMRWLCSRQAFALCEARGC